MPAILNIETATPLCSVCLSLDGRIIAQRETMEEKSHASRLTVFIEEILKGECLQIKDLDAIAAGKGPGSYTGLRIGVSTAKGLCYGANLPLIAIGTLKTLFNQAMTDIRSSAKMAGDLEDALFCPMIDARGMEVFTCLFHASGKEAEPVSAKIVGPETFSPYLALHRVFFFGSGMDKSREVLSHPNAVFIDAVYPHAAAMVSLSEEMFLKGGFENLAYFEPLYLKDFIASASKKGLHV